MRKLNIEELTSNYEAEQGVHAKDCGKHFQAGIKTVLELGKDRKYTRQEMKEAFNASRKSYTVKGGQMDVHHSFDTYMDDLDNKIKDRY